MGTVKVTAVSQVPWGPAPPTKQNASIISTKGQVNDHWLGFASTVSLLTLEVMYDCAYCTVKVCRGRTHEELGGDALGEIKEVARKVLRDTKFCSLSLT